MRKQVIHNVMQCHQFWLSHETSSWRKGVPILLNTTTGEMALTTTALLAIDRKQWLQVAMKIGVGKAPHVYLANQEGYPLQLAIIEAIASEIAKETLRAVDEWMYVPFLSESPHMALAVSAPAVSRVEVEQLLLNEQVGSYLLQAANQPIEEIALALSETNQTIVVLYLLTILEEKGRPVQYLVAATKWGWTILQDLPDLQSEVYRFSKDFTSLLATLPPGKKFSLQITESKKIQNALH